MRPGVQQAPPPPPVPPVHHPYSPPAPPQPAPPPLSFDAPPSPLDKISLDADTLTGNNRIPTTNQDSSVLADAPPPPTPPEVPEHPTPPAPPISPNQHAVPYPNSPVDKESKPSSTSVTLHWSKQPELYPISSTIQLPTGTSIPMPRIEAQRNKLTMYGADKEKLAQIQEAAMHSWAGYRQFAFGHDEVMPVSGGTNDPFNGWGATLVDGLDTLWVMGLQRDFEEAVEQVRLIDFTTSLRSEIPLFETVIRYLGGLLGAYDVSGGQYRVLLDKAVELAEVLYGAFDTPNRVPITYYPWYRPKNSLGRRASSRSILAEIGTLELEFTRLAQLTGEPKYYDAVARVMDLFEESQDKMRIPGMWPTYIDASGCGKRVSTQSQDLPLSPQDKPPRLSSGLLSHTDGSVSHLPESFVNAAGHAPGSSDPDAVGKAPVGEPGLKRKRQLEEEQEVESELTPRTPPDDVCVPQGFVSISKSSNQMYTMGGASDSMYEYLPKEYLLLGGQVEKYKTMYLASMKVVIDKLLFKPMTETDEDILMLGNVDLKPDWSKPAAERELTEYFSPAIQHLSCFAGGMFAMGGVIFDQPEHVDIGSKLTEGCVWAYNVTATGIMPDMAGLMACEDLKSECKWNESAWWDVLDPYSATRLQGTTVSPPPPPMPPTVQKEALPPNTPVVADGPHPDLRDDSHANLEDATLDPLHPAVYKRQLEALSELPSQPSPSLLPDGEANLPDLASPYDLPTPTKSNAPLSHEDYVKKKIECEGIPPGFTHITDRRYQLRPEAIESVFYMYRITGDPHWREVGWNMWKAVEQHARARYGYSTVSDVTDTESALDDSMESFWLAETLKYFYLLFDDPDNWSLDRWVLNTEAHLFRRPEFDFAA
ncbi:glycosyl hydrolase family 47-domain-containing protein [Neohortaea acidophila]|uniref:alpha-1,2-Mannosidase n=1 Tax=Neohortaea acidophila TaxID=245834 RepID=A0A6A6PQM5_9PEZI|nr:glycosyl hydrolase family 47-domain-containing protein [Neohortaea acidophila]KAF2481934.1 glycosyl hydrolase family 47-domain-containing protein [Neohortaea acidophila]